MGAPHLSEQGRDARRDAPVSRVERRDSAERSSIHGGDERGHLAGSFRGGGRTANAGVKEAWRRFGNSLLPSRMVGPIADSLVRVGANWEGPKRDRKSTRLNSSHTVISYAVFCLKK